MALSCKHRAGACRTRPVATTPRLSGGICTKKSLYRHVTQWTNRSQADEAAAPVAETTESSSAPTKATIAAPVAFNDTVPEELFYEGSGAAAELAISLILGTTLIYAPLTLASIGRRLWIKYKFTNKRVTVTNSSPLFKNQVQVAYKNVREVLTVPRALGLWGDMVIVLKNGDRLQITGLERYADIKRHIESCIVD